ncbi:MAG: zf-TFIIB domain-containing protein [Alphaproteobacteria bacterium]|nr:zf-TFIIB domain-containing protein [Alphaproteobacteria bacterium]
MPLTISPIDGAPMRQINRYGIEFDVCPTTGGVWLDKGELDKLIALVREETLSEQTRQRGHGRYRDEDDDDDHHRHNRHSGGRRSRLFDLFDF